MKNKKKIIGILGGIGPEATGEFYLVLTSKFQEKGLIKSNKDFPQIIINSIPAPELIYENISEIDIKPYIQELKELEKFGSDFIAMICNTIHLFYKELQGEIRIPILDLRKEVKDYLLNKNIKSATILGSPEIIKAELYNFKGIKYITPNKNEMDALSMAVFNFNRGFDKIKQRETVKQVAKRYLDQGVEMIILGCTEIALMLKDENIPKINPMGLLAEATIKYYLK